MALEILLSIESITSDRETATLLDSTVYGTGGNPARAAVGVYVVAQKMNADSSVAATLVVAGNDGDPQTDVSWDITLLNDGWHRILFVAPQDYSAGTTYALYDAVQDAATSIIYRSKQAGNIGNALSNQTYWEVVTATIAANEDEVNESANLNSIVYEFILTPDSEYAYASKIAEASETYLTSLKIPQDVLDTYTVLALLIDGAYVASDRGSYPEGERLCRRLESLIESLN